MEGVVMLNEPGVDVAIEAQEGLFYPERIVNAKLHRRLRQFVRGKAVCVHYIMQVFI
jgi:hypothetical protein